jgi:hypothetical protein
MRILALIGALAIAVALGAAGFFFGGFYSVAATAAEPGIINWALVNVRIASINRRATDSPPVSLDNLTSVEAGARAFAARGCLNCHGGPGVKWAKFTEGMLPYPPDLKDLAKDREPPQLFWVVKKGYKDDRHAELRLDRSVGPGNLDYRGVRQKAADRVGSGLQGVDGCPVGSG